MAYDNTQVYTDPDPEGTKRVQEQDWYWYNQAVAMLAQIKKRTSLLSEIKRGTLPNPYRIQQVDVGRRFTELATAGLVQWFHIGHYVYLHNNTLRLETDAEYKARLV